MGSNDRVNDIGVIGLLLRRQFFVLAAAPLAGGKLMNHAQPIEALFHSVGKGFVGGGCAGVKCIAQHHTLFFGYFQREKGGATGWLFHIGLIGMPSMACLGVTEWLSVFHQVGDPQNFGIFRMRMFGEGVTIDTAQSPGQRDMVIRRHRQLITKYDHGMFIKGGI